MLPTSGTYGFQPSNADLALEAFGRIQIRPSAITAEHMLEARLSAGFVMLDWGNKGVNLWAVDLQSISLVQGVATYNLPGSTVQVLDTYIRTYAMGTPASLAPALATTNGSAVVTVTQAAHGLSVGNWVNFIIPVAIGGLVVFGLYPVASVPDGNTYTILAGANATATASGGAVPSFATTSGSAIVTVTLPNHGYLAGQSFTVQVATTLGGLTLVGAYTIATVPTASTFTITAPLPASSSASAGENGGQAQIAGQVTTVDPTDRWLSPISRSDYAAIPDKVQQAPPTSYWFNRQAVTPTITLWPVPDANGPYVLQFYRMRQLQDVALNVQQGIDLPGRFLNAFASELAARLAVKFRPQSAKDLFLLSATDWATAAGEDREVVPLRLRPDFSPYFR